MDSGEITYASVDQIIGKTGKHLHIYLSCNVWLALLSQAGIAFFRILDFVS